MFEWSATINGVRPISKKNSRIITRNRSLPSAAYKRFNAQALEQLRDQVPPIPYTGDVTATIIIYMKGRLTADIDNLCNSWLDTLQDAGVLLNDDQVVDIHAIKHRGAKEWRSEILIRSIE